MRRVGGREIRRRRSRRISASCGVRTGLCRHLPGSSRRRNASPLGTRHQSRTAATRPLEPIATTEDTGIILFRWFCLQQFFNFTHHRLHHTMPSTTTHVFYNIEPLPSQAEVLSFLWHFSDGCVRGADVKHLRSRDGRTRQARPSRLALC